MNFRVIALSISAVFIFALQGFSASYLKIKPEHLTEAQTPEYKALNENLDIIFNKLKTSIKTDKYPKYFHDYTLEKDDGTQSKTYNYVLMHGVELIYRIDTNELKYVAVKRPELGKCRIMYDYPSGNLHAVQIYTTNSQTFIYSVDGKYIDYEPYIKTVKEKVIQNWKMPSGKRIASLAKDREDLSVSVALTLNKDGSIKKVILLKSSKIDVLDDTAYDAIKASSPFEPFPENFFNEEITITLNFSFSL